MKGQRSMRYSAHDDIVANTEWEGKRGGGGRGWGVNMSPTHLEGTIDKRPFGTLWKLFEAG